MLLCNAATAANCAANHCKAYRTRCCATDATKKAATAEKGSAQHGYIAVCISKRHTGNFGVAKENQFIRRAPLAPFCCRTVLGVQVTLPCINKAYLIEV